MSLLTNHLLSLQSSSTTISTLIFPPPKIFTNALLTPTEITNLIRDTEVHERALFSVPPPPPPPQILTQPSEDPDGNGKTKRRQTVFNVQGGEVSTGASTTRSIGRKNTVVASVLGGELHDEIVGRQRRNGEGKLKEVDVDILLYGVEKLLEVYPLDGARERVGNARKRKGELGRNIERYERLVRDLENRSRDGGGDEDDREEVGLGGPSSKRFGTMNDPWSRDNGVGGDGNENASGGRRVTLAMMQNAQREVKELEMRKRRLEERLEGMERDLGGLAR